MTTAEGDAGAGCCAGAEDRGGAGGPAAPGYVQQRLVELLLDGVAGASRGGTIELVVAQEADEAVASVGGFEVRLPVRSP